MKEEDKKAKSAEYLRARFRDYYRGCNIILPDRFGRREFGFIFFDGDYVQRHLGFSTREEIRNFLVNRAPAHVYHSSAYYEKPAAPTMEQKNWLGADLIFDLDADHIPGAKDLGYAGMLKAVKKHVIRLVDDFLIGDFGFEEKSMTIAFSGARGYHIHVRDPRVLSLESHERREIVDYITGTGLDPESVAKITPISIRRFREKTETLHTLGISPPSEPGWSGRVTQGIIAWVEKLSSMKEEEAVSEIASIEGIGEIGARRIYDTIFRRFGKERTIEKFRSGIIDFFPAGISTKHLFAITNSGINLKRGATDEPVTSDTKRLIRLLSSLHGKTGMRVVPIRRDELEGFDPLRDAIADIFTEETVKVHIQQNIEIDMSGERFNLAQGQNSVPEYVAIFLICRGMATLAWGPADEPIQREARGK